MRFLFVLSALLFIAFSFGTMMHIKTNVAVLLKERKQLAYAHLQLKEDRRVLEAELAYLLRPQRLDEFAKKLALRPMISGQIQTHVEEEV